MEEVCRYYGCAAHSFRRFVCPVRFDRRIQAQSEDQSFPGLPGHVKTTRVVGGHPLLVQACQDAVKEWKFAAAAEETTQIVEFEFRAAD